MIIGITGLIGAGKTAAARILKSLGAVVIDADKIGRKVVEENPHILRKLVQKFGSEILTKNRKLNRKKLASAAFKSELSKRELNRIVHPYLLKELMKELKILSRKSSIVVIDAALLIDWNLDKIVDMVILIHSPEKIRFQRLKARGITENDARTRQKRQFTYSQLRKRADYVIFNKQSLPEMELKLKKILHKAGCKSIDIF